MLAVFGMDRGKSVGHWCLYNDMILLLVILGKLASRLTARTNMVYPEGKRTLRPVGFLTRCLYLGSSRFGLYLLMELTFLTVMGAFCPSCFIFWVLTVHTSVLFTALIVKVLTPNALQALAHPIPSTFLYPFLKSL